MVNSESCMKGYSVYTSVKLVTVACVLMWAAAVKRREVDDTYFSAAVCDSCFSASQQHPELLFEFGRCAYGWRFGQKANNLLRPGGFWEIGVGSAVYSYTPTAGLILAATVIMAVFLPLVSWHACGLNFDYALGPRDPNAGAYDRFDRDLRDRRDQGNGNGSGSGNGAGAAAGNSGGAGESGPMVSGSGEAESEQRRATRLNYGFGFVTHNDQCVFLHYQVALLSGLLIIVLSLLISELYKFNAIPSSGAGAAQQCWVSAYNQPMNTGFDVLTILALVLLLVEAGVNLCVPQHRFFFNVLTGLAMLSVAVLASVMAFTNVLGPANDWLTFWTTIIGVLHLFEVPIVLITVVSRSRPVDYMHL